MTQYDAAVMAPDLTLIAINLGFAIGAILATILL